MSIGQMRRRKGGSGEREFCKMLTASFPEVGEITRNLDQRRLGGEDITMLPGFSIEVKRQEQLQINMWWQQALEQAENRSEKEGLRLIPVLAYRQNRKKWRVCVPLRLFVYVAHPHKIIEMSYESFVTVVKNEWARTRENNNSSTSALYYWA